jgi:hypothetical protein
LLDRCCKTSFIFDISRAGVLVHVDFVCRIWSLMWLEQHWFFFNSKFWLKRNTTWLNQARWWQFNYVLLTYFWIWLWWQWCLYFFLARSAFSINC